MLRSESASFLASVLRSVIPFAFAHGFSKRWKGRGCESAIVTNEHESWASSDRPSFGLTEENAMTHSIVKESPYGSSPGAITVDQLLATSRGLSDIRICGESVYFIEARPDGRQVVVEIIGRWLGD